MKHNLFLVLTISLALPICAFSQQQATIELERDGQSVKSIPLDETQPITINADGTGLTATPEAGFTCGSCDGISVSMAANDGGSFSVDSASVSQGRAIRLSWTSRGAWVCEGQGLPGTTWPAPNKLPNADELVVLDIEPGQYQASIRCSNGVDNFDTRGPIAIEVTPSTVPVPEGCEGRQPQLMTQAIECKAGSANVDCSLYENLYESVFPGTGRGQQIFTNRNEYIALQFTMPDHPSTARGTWNFITPQQPPTNTGPVVRTISKCPGDFDLGRVTQEMGARCYHNQVSDPISTLAWVMAGSGNIGCELTPGETYYFNILYTNSPKTTPGSDVNWQCGSDPALTVCSSNTSSNFGGL